jgi:hypothetical protein
MFHWGFLGVPKMQTGGIHPPLAEQTTVPAPGRKLRRPSPLDGRAAGRAASKPPPIRSTFGLGMTPGVSVQLSKRRGDWRR